MPIKVNRLQNESDGRARRAGPSKRRVASHFLYVIAGDHGFLKIGHSAAPRSRLSELQVGSATALKLVETWRCRRPAALALERAAHAAFAWARVRGEWHDVTVAEAKTVLNMLKAGDARASVMAAMIKDMRDLQAAEKYENRRYYSAMPKDRKRVLAESKVEVDRLCREHALLRAEAQADVALMDELTLQGTSRATRRRCGIPG